MYGLSDISLAKAFFNGWTRKEAYLKARSVGISSGLNHFAVSFQPVDSVRLISYERYPEEVASWSFHDILVDPASAGAVAVRVSLSIRCFNARFFKQ